MTTLCREVLSPSCWEGHPNLVTVISLLALSKELIAELRRPDGPPRRAPYSSCKRKGNPWVDFALRHSGIFDNHKCQSHGNKHHRLLAVHGKGYMRSQESWANGDLWPLRSNMLPRHIITCVLVFFLPWIHSTPTEAVATSAMPAEVSPCSTTTFWF